MLITRLIRLPQEVCSLEKVIREGSFCPIKSRASILTLQAPLSRDEQESKQEIQENCRERLQEPPFGSKQGHALQTQNKQLNQQIKLSDPDRRVEAS